MIERLDEGRTGRIDGRNRRWWILAAMSGVLGLVVLDETVVGVALGDDPARSRMPQVASHWVVNAYFLTFTCFVAVGGRLGDSLGHRGVFVLGVTVFGLPRWPPVSPRTAPG